MSANKIGALEELKELCKEYKDLFVYFYNEQTEIHKRTVGKWKRYKKGNNYKNLYDEIGRYGQHCFENEEDCKQKLDSGDIYVYFFGKNVSRVIIRMNSENEIEEIKGVYSPVYLVHYKEVLWSIVRKAANIEECEDFLVALYRLSKRYAFSSIDRFSYKTREQQEYITREICDAMLKFEESRNNRLLISNETEIENDNKITRTR